MTQQLPHKISSTRRISELFDEDSCQDTTPEDLLNFLLGQDLEKEFQLRKYRKHRGRRGGKKIRARKERSLAWSKNKDAYFALIGEYVSKTTEAHKELLGREAQSPVLSLAERQRFHRLADQWEKQTRNMSSPNAVANHPTVKEIIAMGAAVVPLILNRMRCRPWFWFDALVQLTNGDDPVTPEMHGDMMAMTDAWIQWGHDRGIVR